MQVIVQDVAPETRLAIERMTASGETLGSDVCIGVMLDGKLIGWGDDYGTFRVLPAPTSGGEIERAGELLLQGVSQLLAVSD